MREIRKIDEPEFWHAFKQRNTKLRYKDVSRLAEGKELTARLRRYLLEEQHYLCAYCCREVDMSSSHNEHVKPESCYANETMDYENIVASCNCESTCGRIKENRYDEDKFISPTMQDCNEMFEYTDLGFIRGKGLHAEQAEYTIKILNLNEYGLVAARKALLQECYSLKDSVLVRKYYLHKDEKHDCMFADMVKCYLDKGLFDV